MIRVAPYTFALALAACAAEPQTDEAPTAAGAPTVAAASPTAAAPTAATAPSATPALAIEAEGLRLFNRDTGSARAISFGTDWRQALAALAFRGPPGTGVNRECGAGPLDYASWPDGLTLYAQGGKFAGWAVDGRGAGGIATAAGVGPGSTLTQLQDAHAAKLTQSTLGTEFSAGELYGLLDGPGPGAEVTNMWAGVSCNLR